MTFIDGSVLALKEKGLRRHVEKSFVNLDRSVLALKEKGLRRKGHVDIVRAGRSVLALKEKGLRQHIWRHLGIGQLVQY